MPALEREAAWAEERLLGDLRQSVPQNGHVHLHPFTHYRPSLSRTSLHRMAGNLEGPTRKPRHASVFSTHSDTQAVPAFHCIRMFKSIFSTRAFLKCTDTLSTIAHKRPKNEKPFRHASVFKTRVLTRACPFLKRAF